jgi:hypothetical protein
MFTCDEDEDEGPDPDEARDRFLDSECVDY